MTLPVYRNNYHAHDMPRPNFRRAPIRYLNSHTNLLAVGVVVVVVAEELR